LILVDTEFPFSLPRVAVENGPDLFSWPHLEENGLLCLVPNFATSNFSQPVQLVENILGAACELISENLAQVNYDEFRNEFESYWRYKCDITVASIFKPCGPTREISMWKGEREWFFGDDKSELKIWLNNRFCKKSFRDFKLGSAFLVWLDYPWIPSEYPLSPKDSLEFMQRHIPNSHLHSVSKFIDGGLSILVAAPSSNGVCFAALTHRLPQPLFRGPGKPGVNQIAKGFRPKKVPPRLQLTRALSPSAKLVPASVTRADPAWIHGRDQDNVQSLLKDSVVLVIGVGSLGSEIVSLLAKSGVGNITLVDAETLEWANISRHQLGAKFVGRSKVLAMKQFTNEMLPHINISTVDQNFLITNDELIEQIMASDLVISATGHWETSVLLNNLQINRAETTKIIFTWMEEHAFAAHSVLIDRSRDDGCLLCGFNLNGSPKMTVTHWDVDQTRSTPTCAGAFMPYGAVNLSLAASLAAGHCIDVLCNVSSPTTHRLWVGNKLDIEAAGGCYSDQFVSAYGKSSVGGFQTTMSWPRDLQCQQCQSESSQ
ncbi:MAG: ThiF family adenylyltransferase, partial [Halothiobacillus sp.]|jgi:molybdopterin/thiamine biosynthesis adenylyltransferase|nr:ThiF family adenylyltransferase [Halothiobacillus sp.]